MQSQKDEILPPLFITAGPQTAWHGDRCMFFSVGILSSFSGGYANLTKKA